MTILHAMEYVDGPKWVRPVAWRGTGHAISVRDGVLQVVPSARGGFAWQPKTSEVLDIWELVDPEDVCLETSDSQQGES